MTTMKMHYLDNFACLKLWYSLLTSLPLQAKVVPNNDPKRTYSVCYVPKVAGPHKVMTTVMITPV